MSLPKGFLADSLGRIQPSPTIAVTDKAAVRDRVTCYGAIGVGGLKMKIHKTAIRKLFEANDQVLDTAEVYRIGEGL